VRVFAFPEPIDLRKGYDGLFGLVKTGLGRDPLSGDLFLFVNKRRRGCKVLVWDGTGLCIFQKRHSRPGVRHAGAALRRSRSVRIGSLAAGLQAATETAVAAAGLESA
jgi:hypothetical protein